MGKITTSLNIEESVYKSFKKKCIDKDVDFSEGLVEALQDWLRK